MGGQLRPKHITQDAFAAKLREAGFPACSKAAVSLAERSKESGVEFTAEARKVAQKLLNRPTRAENRKDGNKTTVWLDDELREWVETRAYMEDIPVGELIRRILREAKESAASDAGTNEAAEGRLSWTQSICLQDITKQEENQV